MGLRTASASKWQGLSHISLEQAAASPTYHNHLCADAYAHAYRIPFLGLLAQGGLFPSPLRPLALELVNSEGWLCLAQRARSGEMAGGRQATAASLPGTQGSASTVPLDSSRLMPEH